MTCVDQPGIRRARLHVHIATLVRRLVAGLAARRGDLVGDVDDLNDYMLADIGFSDGRVTEARIRRAVGQTAWPGDRMD